MLGETQIKKIENIISKFNEIESTIRNFNLNSESKNEFIKLNKIEKSLFSIIEIYNTYQTLYEKYNLNVEFVNGVENKNDKQDLKKLLLDDEEKLNIIEQKLIQRINEYENDHLNINNKVMVKLKTLSGGDDASFMLEDMFMMYKRFFEKHKVKVDQDESYEVLNRNRIKVILKGDNIYELLKYETGIHKFKQLGDKKKYNEGSIVVYVSNIAEEHHYQLKDSDLKFETFKSSGAGGQHVNKTDSAVRVIHIPTGITISSQVERSQHMNKKRAIEKLRSKLYEIELKERLVNDKQENNKFFSIGKSSEKIRTYDYHNNEIVDHRLKKKYNMSNIFSGNLNLIIDDLKKI